MGVPSPVKIATDICRSLVHMHEDLLLAHMDVKSMNIVVSNDWTAKLVDFGTSQVDLDVFILC